MFSVGFKNSYRFVESLKISFMNTITNILSKVNCKNSFNSIAHNNFRTLFFASILFTVNLSNAQTVFGIWKNIDEKTKKVDSKIEIYQKDGKAYAKIIDIIDKKQINDVCDKCTGTKKNKPLLGMHLFEKLVKKGDEWTGGTILDPNNGEEYNCYIILESTNKLKIRGYIGFSLFGRTAYWYRDTN